MGQPTTAALAKHGLTVARSRQGSGQRSFDLPIYTVAVGEVDEWTATDSRTGQPATDVQWDVDTNVTIQNYQATITNTQLVNVGDNENLTANPTTLCFWQTGQYLIQVTTTDPDPISGGAIVNVVAPTVTVTSGPTIGEVRAGPDGDDASYWMLQIAQAQGPLGVDQRGMQVTFSIAGQGLAGTDVVNGTVAVLQLVNTSRWLQDADETFWQQMLNGQLVLDRPRLPNGWGNSPFIVSQPLTPTSTATIPFYDSPGVRQLKAPHRGFYVPFDSSYNPEQFLTFLMFSPDPQWGVFVPLGFIEWNWQGKTEALSENEWTPAVLADAFCGDYDSAENYGFPQYAAATSGGNYVPFTPPMRNVRRAGRRPRRA
jgi:hypothetical protein